MAHENFHLSDEELLLAADGELSARRNKQVQSHLAACWSCRARLRTIEETIADFVAASRQAHDSRLPPAAGPRSSLQAKMAAIAAAQAGPSQQWTHRAAWVLAAAAIVIVCAAITWNARRMKLDQSVVVAVPRANLTPGAVLLVSKEQVCMDEHANNRTVPVATRRRVFQAYGIPESDARSYEVDYLITPALGGSDDIHNLWPQSYSATAWNARAKDELEEQLREMVCAGDLDLATAQREISRDWIAAYKKYLGHPTQQ